MLRRVHEISGYPSFWPSDPGGWITPHGMIGAWVAEHDGQIAGHINLIRGLRLECLLRATGLDPDELGGVARLYVDPAFRRLGLARGLLDTAADAAIAHGLLPVLDVVADSFPAIALYEQAGWRLACTQPAWWTDPDGSTPTIRCYLRPRPLAPPSALAPPAGRTRPAGLSFFWVPNGPWFPLLF
jgi:GNAT superfamily N-acetyltransferase